MAVARKPNLCLGITVLRHAQFRHARAGLQHLNDFTIKEIEMQRDANKVLDNLQRRIRIHQFNSRHFRRSPIANMARPLTATGNRPILAASQSLTETSLVRCNRLTMSARITIVSLEHGAPTKRQLRFAIGLTTKATWSNS